MPRNPLARAGSHETKRHQLDVHRGILQQPRSWRYQDISGLPGLVGSGACGATRDVFGDNDFFFCEDLQLSNMSTIPEIFLIPRLAETGCQRRWLRGLSSTHVLMKLTVIQYGFQTHRLWLWTQMRDHSTGLEQCRVFLSCEWFRDWVSCVWYPFCDLSIHIVWLTRAHEKKRSRFMQNRSLERFLNSHLTESYMVSYKLQKRYVYIDR